MIVAAEQYDPGSTEGSDTSVAHALPYEGHRQGFSWGNEVSGIFETLALSAGVSGVVKVVPGAVFAWSPGETMGRTGETLSSRDPRGGEEVEAFDVIDPELLLLPLGRSEIDHPKCFREHHG